MNDMLGWMAAEAERPEVGIARRRRVGPTEEELCEAGLRVHNFPGTEESPSTEDTEGRGEIQNPDFCQKRGEEGHPSEEGRLPGEFEYLSEVEERERRIYRGRTVAMLRRYMRYSLETGRLPSLLGREFFRAKVTSYTVVTFEDRVIFVHDMEKCLEKLDEFSRQLIARHVLQEHDRWATARLLHCNEKTVRRLTPMAIDQLSEILLDLGLMERIDGTRKKSCQGGKEGEIFASDCEGEKYKF